MIWPVNKLRFSLETNKKASQLSPAKYTICIYCTVVTYRCFHQMKGRTGVWWHYALVQASITFDLYWT